MSTIDVKDASGSTVTVEKPLAPGRAAATASRPVVLSNEDAAFLDGIETALAALGTQTTLAAVLAKILTAPATEAKQDNAITQETAINTVLGVKGDAKSTATDATSISVMQVAKQISASAQLSATAAKQPALGTAGSASTDVITVQGIASGTAQPVSAASLPLPALAATSTKQSDGSHKSQIVDGSGNVIGATTNALDVNIKSGASSGAVAQGSATSGQTGSLIQGAVTTGAPSYTTAQTSPLSLDTAGNLRVNVIAGGAGGGIVTQATGTNLHTVVDSGTITTVSTVTAITNALPAGAALLGKVGIDQTTPGTTNAVSAAQSGTWTVQPGNTANTTAWKVDGSAVTQPVSVASIPSHAVTNAGTFATQPAGSVAHDGAAAGVNPNLIGGYASAAAPSDVSADTDSVRAWYLRSGSAAVTVTAGGALVGGDATNGLDVDVTRLSSLVAGAAIIGKVGIDQTTDGTTNLVAAKQSGTWTIQPGNTANTTAWKVDGSAVTQPISGSLTNIAGTVSLPTGASTAALQPAVYTEDAPAASDPTGNMMLAVRRDTLSAAEVSADGDNVALKATNKGQLHTFSFQDTTQWIGASGVNGTAVQRVTIATDDTIIASLATKLDSLHTDALPVGAGTAAAAGRITLASDDPAVATLGVTTAAKVITDANGTIQQYLRGLVSQWIAGTLVVGAGANIIGSVTSRVISATVSTLTRQANVTAYAVNDSISDNATAASVTALSATITDTNDAPSLLTSLELNSTDTGLGTANAVIRAWLYNSDPTASTGVVGGDNLAFSNKKAGFIGTMSGVMRAFSDGSRGRLTPDEGNFVEAPPSSGAKLVYVQYQTLTAFTPSANSTTLIGTVRGMQGRA